MFISKKTFFFYEFFCSHLFIIFLQFLFCCKNRSISWSLISELPSYVSFKTSIDTSTGGEHTIHGVEMEDGTVLTADNILSGCSPYTTFIELMGEDKPTINENESNSNPNHMKESEVSDRPENIELPQEFVHHLQHTDFSCGAFKINCAVDRLPNFTCYPSPLDGKPGPMHMGEIFIISYQPSFYFHLNY